MGDKWLVKKRRRKEALFLAKEPNSLQFQKEKSVHVLVSNGGVVNGLSQDALRIILPAAERIHMPFDKDYAFVKFRFEEEAEKAMSAINGIRVQSVSELDDLLPESLKRGPPLHLFLSYIRSLPSGCDSEALAESEAARQQHLPPGLVLIEDFVSEEEERSLLFWLNKEFQREEEVECLKHRQVMHFGYKFNYTTNNVDHTHPLPSGMPAPIQDLVDRILLCGHVKHSPDQVTVNRYPPGAGIPAHVDTHSAFMEEIVSLSLGSQVVMDFTEVLVSGIAEKLPILLPSRSLLVMSGASRYGYTHAISARTFDPITMSTCRREDDNVGMTTVPRTTRTSITFRALRLPPRVCTCEFPLACDSQRTQPEASH